MNQRLPDEGVAHGIITRAPRDALLNIVDSEPAGPEGRAGFTGVNVACGLGALLVLFASGVVLVSQLP